MPKHGKRIDKQKEEEIMLLSKKHNVDPDIIKRIIKDFETMDNFKEHYVEYAIHEGSTSYDDLIRNYIKLLDGKIIQAFDLESKDLICRENNYLNFNKENNFPIFYDVQKYKEATLEKLKTICPVNYEVVQLFFGLDKEKLSKAEIANKFGFSKGKVDKIIRDSVSRYNDMEKVTDGIYDVENLKQRKFFLQTYFENYDIFYTPEEQELFNRDFIASNIFNENLKEYKVRIEQKGDKTGVNRITRNLRGYKSNVIDTMDQLSDMKNIDEYELEKTLLTRIENLEKKYRKLRMKDNYLELNSNEFSELFKEYKDIERRSTDIAKLNLFNSTTNALKRNGVLLLNNLVEKDIPFVKTLNFVYPSQKEAIINAVHSLGYSFSNENEETDELKTIREQISTQDKDEELQIRNEELEKERTLIKVQKEIINDEKNKRKNFINRIQQVQENDLEDWQRIELEKLRQEIENEEEER